MATLNEVQGTAEVTAPVVKASKPAKVKAPKPAKNDGLMPYVGETHRDAKASKPATAPVKVKVPKKLDPEAVRLAAIRKAKAKGMSAILRAEAEAKAAAGITGAIRRERQSYTFACTEASYSMSQILRALGFYCRAEGIPAQQWANSHSMYPVLGAAAQQSRRGRQHKPDASGNPAEDGGPWTTPILTKDEQKELRDGFKKATGLEPKAASKSAPKKVKVKAGK